MSNKIIIFAVIGLLTSCSNWKYKDIEYERCAQLEKVHVHLYHHDTCEWYCLNMEEGEYTIEDSFRVKYRTDKKGKVTKVKLIK